MHRLLATRAGRTPSVPNARLTGLGRVSDVRLAYVEICIFFNTPGARFTYTLMYDCCLKDAQMTKIIHPSQGINFLYNIKKCWVSFVDQYIKIKIQTRIANEP